MKILLDTDAGVDDALAILLLLRCPDLTECVGITVAAGNTPLKQSVANTLRVLEVARLYTDGKTAPIPPVSAGAANPLKGRLVHATEVHGHDGLGGVSLLVDRTGRALYPEAEVIRDPRPAYRFILDTAAKYPGEVSLVAIAPLTNLALAVWADLDGFRKLKEIVLMGGAFRHDGNVTAAAEFNIYVDPEAASVVLDSGVPVTMVPLDVTEKARILPEDIAGPGLVRAFARQMMGTAFDFHERFEGFRGCYFHDPLAMGIALDRTLADGIKTRVVVEEKGSHTRGMTIAGLRPNHPLIPGEPNATVCLQCDAPRFEAFFRDRVLPAGA